MYQNRTLDMTVQTKENWTEVGGYGCWENFLTRQTCTDLWPAVYDIHQVGSAGWFNIFLHIYFQFAFPLNLKKKNKKPSQSSMKQQMHTFLLLNFNKIDKLYENRNYTTKMHLCYFSRSLLKLRHGSRKFTSQPYLLTWLFTRYKAASERSNLMMIKVIKCTYRQQQQRVLVSSKFG